MQKQSFGLGLFSLTALRRTADLQGMLSAKTADLAPVVPVIALVELNDSNQPRAVSRRSINRQHPPNGAANNKRGKRPPNNRVNANPPTYWCFRFRQDRQKTDGSFGFGQQSLIAREMTTMDRQDRPTLKPVFVA